MSYYKPFMLTRTGYTADAPCAHMEVYMSIWQEVYITTPWNYGFILFYSKSLFIFSMLHQLCNFWYYILCSPVKHSVTWFFKGSNEIKIAWELLLYYGSLEETHGCLLWVLFYVKMKAALLLTLLSINSLSVHDLQIIYPWFEFNWPS